MGKKLFFLQIYIFLPFNLHKIHKGRECPAIQRYIDTLLNIEDKCAKARTKFKGHQSNIKRWFDKNYTGKKYFQVSDLVFKWDNPHEYKVKH